MKIFEEESGFINKYWQPALISLWNRVTKALKGLLAPLNLINLLLLPEDV